jgi:hypothetical protein
MVEQPKDAADGTLEADEGSIQAGGSGTNAG